MSLISKPFIVAEMSANHLGSLSRALDIVDAAAVAGADAIKLQTWVPGTMCVDRDYTLGHGTWYGANLSDLYRHAYLPWEFHPPIFERAAERGIECFSAPFDCASVDFLETLGCPRYKIASFELVDLELIRYVARKGKPMILSTGMATEQEISQAYFECVDKVAGDVTILKCTSAYPADASDANLATMRQQLDHGVRAGLSDHTPGIGVAVAAAALGAVMIEKHLTLSRAEGGLDAGFSMEPHEFTKMVIECRRAAAAIGIVQYGPGPSESTSLRRSMYMATSIRAGEIITAGHLCTARPAMGLPCNQADLAIGKRAAFDMEAGTALTLAGIAQ